MDKIVAYLIQQGATPEVAQRMAQELVAGRKAQLASKPKHPGLKMGEVTVTSVPPSAPHPGLEMGDVTVTNNIPNDKLTPDQAAVRLRGMFKTQEEADAFSLQGIMGRPVSELTPEQARIRLLASFKTKDDMDRFFGPGGPPKADPNVNMITGKPLRK